MAPGLSAGAGPQRIRFIEGVERHEPSWGGLRRSSNRHKGSRGAGDFGIKILCRRPSDRSRQGVPMNVSGNECPLSKRSGRTSDDEVGSIVITGRLWKLIAQ